MNIRSFCWLALCLLFSTAQAQIYRPGSLVTNDGDTLKGLVAVQADNTFAYKAGKNSVASFYNVKDLAGYQLGDEVYQQYTVEVLRGNFPEKVRTYLRLVEDGPLMLLEYNGGDIYGGQHVNYFLHNGTDTPWRVNRSRGNFRTTMKNYFREDEDLARKIKQKEYGYDDLQQIVKEYNEWYIEREKNSPPEPEPDDNPDNDNPDNDNAD